MVSVSESQKENGDLYFLKYYLSYPPRISKGERRSKHTRCLLWEGHVVESQKENGDISTVSPSFNSAIVLESQKENGD